MTSTRERRDVQGRVKSILELKMVRCDWMDIKGSRRRDKKIHRIFLELRQMCVTPLHGNTDKFQLCFVEITELLVLFCQTVMCHGHTVPVLECRGPFGCLKLTQASANVSDTQKQTAATLHTSTTEPLCLALPLTHSITPSSPRSLSSLSRPPLVLFTGQFE